MARTDHKRKHDPHGLVPWVKQVVRLHSPSAVAGQPDSPSGQAGWGLGLVSVVASCSALLHHPGKLDGVVT